jgi:hypothetical protein
MTASHALPDTAQEIAFHKSIELFESENVNQHELTSCWQAALPTYAEQIQDFLQKQLENFKQGFLGQEQVVFPVDPNAADRVKPWSVQDLNVYYTSRTDKPLITKVLNRRRILTINQHPFTEFDDYQLLRDLGSDSADKRARLQIHLDKLHIISYSCFAIGKSSRPQRFYFLTILSILDYFRSLLPRSEDPTYSSETIIRIDAITEHVALFYLNVITQLQVDEEETMLKEMLKVFDNFDQEISPWLALYFRPTVLAENNSENKIILEFLKFHKLRHPESVLELIAKPFGGNFEEVLVELLGAEKKLVQNFGSKTFAEKLKSIKKSLYTPKLSDWMATNILRVLVKESIIHGHEIEFSYIVFHFILRIRSHSCYLPHTKDYLNTILHDIKHNMTEKQHMVDTCPALYLSLNCDTKFKFQLAAKEINQYPPSSALFYAKAGISQPIADLDQDEEKIPDSHLEAITQLKTFEPEKRRQYLTAIFSEYRYLNNHIEFLSTETVKELDLNVNALYQYYIKADPSTDIVKLWELFLDSHSIDENHFFSYHDNCKLFSYIQSQKNMLLDAQKIMQHPERYRRLALALDIFITAQGKIDEMFSLLRNPGKIFLLYFTPSYGTTWARDFYADIIRLVAYPVENSTMNFANIVRFMNVPLDRRIPLNLDTIVTQATKYVIDYYAYHLELNANHINKLIFSFMKLYNTRELLSSREVAKTKAFPIQKLHPLCITWADLSLHKDYYALGIFEPVSRQLDFFEIVAKQSTLNLVNLMGSSFDRSFPRSIMGTSEQSLQSDDELIHSVAFQLNYNSAYCNSRLQKGLSIDTEEQELVAFQSKPVDVFYEEQQVLSFIKIYDALRVAQSGPTTNWVKKVNLENLPMVQALEIIKSHANKPGSRTQKAWELVAFHGIQPLNGNFELIKTIYAYGFRHSLFKKSSFMGENIYRTSTLEKSFQNLHPFFISLHSIPEADTRLGKIVRTLGR